MLRQPRQGTPRWDRGQPCLRASYQAAQQACLCWRAMPGQLAQRPSLPATALPASSGNCVRGVRCEAGKGGQRGGRRHCAGHTAAAGRSWLQARGQQAGYQRGGCSLEGLWRQCQQVGGTALDGCCGGGCRRRGSRRGLCCWGWRCIVKSSKLVIAVASWHPRPCTSSWGWLCLCPCPCPGCCLSITKGSKLILAATARSRACCFSCCRCTRGCLCCCSGGWLRIVQGCELILAANARRLGCCCLCPRWCLCRCLCVAEGTKVIAGAVAAAALHRCPCRRFRPGVCERSGLPLTVAGRRLS